MRESYNPHWAAVVAAPILKLCPAYFSAGSPAAVRAVHSLSTKTALVKNFPLCHLNRVPGPFPLKIRNPSIASIGHRVLYVAPRWIVNPWRKGSVLEALMRTSSCEAIHLDIRKTEVGSLVKFHFRRGHHFSRSQKSKETQIGSCPEQHYFIRIFAFLPHLL